MTSINWDFRSISERAPQELERRGETSYQTNLVNHFLNPSKLTHYNQYDFKLPREQPPRTFTPLKPSLLYFLELDDFYTHPLDILSNRIAYLTVDGALFTDTLENMPFGDWSMRQIDNTFELDPHHHFHNLKLYQKKALIGSQLSLFLVDLQREQAELCFKLPDVLSMEFERQLLHLGRDKTYCILDLRQSSDRISHSVPVEKAIKVAPHFPYTLASEVHRISLYDQRMFRLPLHTYAEHVSRVRALTWKNPTQFYSGGGIQDHTLKLWDANKPTSLKTVDCLSQVLDIHLRGDRIFSFHGFGPEAENLCQIWREASTSFRKLEKQSLGNTPSRPLFSAFYQDTCYVAHHAPSHNTTELTSYSLSPKRN